MEYKFALVGNPNVGKTSLYNRITHSFEHVGNWHGVTVSAVDKTVKHGGDTIRITDLPGLYSLSVYSFEEEISRDCILGGDSDVIINICEVNNLSRNLYLTLQLLESGVPTVLVVNMMDELEKRGGSLDCAFLERALGVPVVAMSAKYRTDVNKLLDTCVRVAKEKKTSSARLGYLDKLPLGAVVSAVKINAENVGLNVRYAAIKLLENDAFVADKLQLDDAKKSVIAKIGDSQAKVAQVRYEFIDKITAGALTEKGGKNTPPAAVSKLDKIVLNKYAALPIFLLVMAAVFVITFGVAGNFFTWLLELGIDKLIYDPLTNRLNDINCPAWIVGLLGDGIVRGVGGILVFLPQIVLLFFFLALLEDSGYVSRVAFMTDGLFRKVGLSGRSAFTMLMGFGCSATAVLTARGLEDDKMRKKTVLLTPFLSCSARLPVYSTVAAAYFAAGSPFIIFGMYLLGAAVAFALAAVFEHCIKSLKSGKPSFIMEMPPYRFPTAERVLQLIWNNTKVFLIRVGTVIFALNVIVWLLSNFSFTVGYTVGTDARSILETLSGAIAPVFKPFGFGNWKAVTSLLGGLVAKEVVISSIESLGGVEAVFSSAPYPALSALTFMVFTLLYVPCVATLGAIKKEAGTKWMFFGLVLQLSVAYTVSLVFYGIGLCVTVNPGLTAGVTAIAAVALVCSVTAASVIRGKRKCAYCAGGCKNCDRKDKK